MDPHWETLSHPSLRIADPLLILTFLQTATAQTEYFKVPFTDVLDLVRKRAVYIKKGCAYVSQVSGADSGTRRVDC